MTAAQSPFPSALVDRFGRRVSYVRMSVTDRCNFRCVYCMSEDMTFAPRSQILTLEEIAELGAAFCELGVSKLRITGGEPLVRHNVLWLFRSLGQLPGLKDLTLTTNGALLPKYARELKDAGVTRINISLDSLDEERFRGITRTGELGPVLEGIDAALEAGFARLKLNAVVLKNRNHDEVRELVGFALARGLDLLMLGEEVARGLGARVGRVRLLAGAVAVLLASTAVSVVGPIGFIGLMAPHLVRLAGVRAHAMLAPAAALWGGTLLVGADVLARLVPSGSSTLPVGAATAFLGAPFIIWLARTTAGAATAPAAGFTPPAPRRPITLLLGGSATVLVIAVGAGLAFGALSITPGAVLAAVLGNGDDLATRVVLDQRLPRTLVAALAGAALATSGALLQGVVRNPLAAPEIVGVTSGAGAAALAALVAFPSLPSGVVPLAAFLGGAVAFAVVYAASWKRGINPIRLALVGLAVAALLSAVINALTVAAGLRVAQALTWLAGSTYARDWGDVARLMPWVGVLVPIAWAMARRLDLLALGEEVPIVLGLPLERARLALLAVGVALSAAAVATVGTLSFAGLMGPHIARSLAGTRHARLLPVTALVGAALVVLADLVGRTAFAPREIPSGLGTAALGAPYFLWLLTRARRGGHL